MKLGPETRRIVGDNYERIIIQILRDFGWQLVNQNFETPVPKEVRNLGLQGGDALFTYFDPLLNYNIGTFVESKKCKDMTLFKRQIKEWLKNLNLMVHNLDTQIFTIPLVEKSRNSHVRIQEGLLSVWVDEGFDSIEFQSIVSTELKDLTNSSSPSDFAILTIFGNHKLRQLQRMIESLFALRGKLQLSGECDFMYPKAGPEFSPNMMMLASDYFFIRAQGKHENEKAHLLAFHLGDTSVQQVNHFTASLIDRIGTMLKMSQSLHIFVWDYPPSDPSKTGLWNSLVRQELERKYTLPNGFISIQGFNSDYLNLS